MYVYGALICLCIAIGTVIGLRRRSATDGILVTLATATAIASLASLRYLEIAVLWMLGTPAAGVKLLGLLCLTPAPWVLASGHRTWNPTVCADAVATAVLLGTRTTSFPFPSVYIAAVLSAVTRTAAIELPRHKTDTQARHDESRQPR
ncbi:hypothetical protein ABII15_34260 [Streptomyces sp. HUAS MG91]|uniref:Integral membrane protein n=1 Tax=Streptomyces tabacisoli TaxID=3156398 RepID=A0AAU8J2I2_9ACTN